MKFNYIEIFWWLLLLGIGFIIVVGYQPYAVLGDYIVGSDLSGLKGFPFVGVILFWAVTMLAKCGALVVYLVIQFLELLWIHILNSPEILQKMIGKSKHFYVVGSDDSFWEKTAKNAYNAIPYALIRDAVQWAVVAYLVDFVVNGIGLSPVKGRPVVDIFWVLATGQVELINWGNVFRIVLGLFVLEALYIVSIQVHRAKQLLRD